MSKGTIRKSSISLGEAHLNEMKRKKATVYNFGKVQTGNGIYSTTNKGGLTTTRKHTKRGGFSHQWEEEDNY